MDKAGYIVLGIIVVFLVGMWYLSSGTSSNSVPYFSDASPVLYFYSDTCPHCIAMKPILQQLGSEGFRIKPMELQTHGSDFTKYNVPGTPTWVTVNNTERIEGETDIATLRAFLLRNNAKIA
ncbi:Thioredoxin [uncultured archaeon]|nr:Thioredoxin [uncultured archaeon]